MHRFQGAVPESASGAARVAEFKERFRSRPLVTRGWCVPSFPRHPCGRSGGSQGIRETLWDPKPAEPWEHQRETPTSAEPSQHDPGNPLSSTRR